MVLYYGPQAPSEVTAVYNLGRRQRTVNFDIEELAEVDPAGNTHSWRSVTLEPGVWSYGSLVSAIVGLRYQSDSVEAITANIIGTMTGETPEEKRAEYEEEFNAFSAWRNHAKEVAKHILEQYP